MVVIDIDGQRKASVIHLGRLGQPASCPHYSANSGLIITDLRVGLRPHTQHTRDNEVTIP